MNTHLRVAVCTNRLPAAVAEALSALGGQVEGGSLALVLSGLPAAEEEAHRAAFDGVVLVEPRPGLSRARNRALAWAAESGADALAFVDDDAVVDPGWRAALGRRWDEAPASVACIGGPIRPRYSVPLPSWFSDGIAHALTLLDRGPGVRDLDPSLEAVYGANISFRVDPLREIGGFDPALGHAGARVFFAEEDEAQRALVRLGYGVRYVPDAAVEHLIPPERLTRASFIRRRFWFGAALGLRGGRGPGHAARQALISGVGALAAAARRRDARAMERAVRAAENLGVLAAPLVSRRR
ncbi:MAG: glucosyl-dolichyl phosphate glucuronosyltransferase [Thermoleophilaceae bacterium]|jgi:succinoglycan biosynthesis protein ExoM|nr:glucosyl-dolichyl phosphate glucuronosyltransferase [Thermoleophilaceae bacterium]